MHKFASRRATAPQLRPHRPHLSATHVIRAAGLGDVEEIHALVAANAERGLLLARTVDEIALMVDDYVVAADANGRVLACAAIHEYSPSLAEIGSVAVSETAQGQGLGSIVVRGAEAMARRRGIDELFALTLADRFFESLGYEKTSLSRYPEKLARYDALARRGVDIVPKTCYRKFTA
jgi:amino-acid N-acetyltransferase